jgi:hypothetical protein
MVPLDSRGVIFSLEDSFTKHDKRPGKNDVIRRFPFLPYVIEGLPSPFGAGTLEETMLRGFRGLLSANLAHGEGPLLEGPSNMCTFAGPTSFRVFLSANLHRQRSVERHFVAAVGASCGDGHHGLLSGQHLFTVLKGFSSTKQRHGITYTIHFPSLGAGTLLFPGVPFTHMHSS